MQIKILFIAIFILFNNSCENNPSLCGVIDNCGVCDNDPTNDCEQDCFGDWGGNSIADCAEVCDGLSKYDCDNNCITPDANGTYAGNFFLGCQEMTIEETCNNISYCIWSNNECIDNLDSTEIPCDCEGNIEDECGICPSAIYAQDYNGPNLLCGCSGLPQLASGGIAESFENSSNFTILGQYSHVWGISFNTLGDDGSILKPYSIIEANDANRNCGTLTELKINGAVDYLENIIIYQSETSSNPITFDYSFIDYCSDEIDEISDGCKLNSNRLFVTSDNKVLFNTSVNIRSFEFDIIGGGIVERSCNCDGNAYNCTYQANECNINGVFNQELCESSYSCFFDDEEVNSNEQNCETSEEEGGAGGIWEQGQWTVNDHCATNAEEECTSLNCDWDGITCVSIGEAICLSDELTEDDEDNDGICDDIDSCISDDAIEASCGSLMDAFDREYCGCLGEFGTTSNRCPIIDCSGVCGGNNNPDIWDSNGDGFAVGNQVMADSLNYIECLSLNNDNPIYCNDNLELYSDIEVDINGLCGCNQGLDELSGCCCGIAFDECGICGGDGKPQNCGPSLNEECCDCSGNYFSEIECDCDGTLLDECGICDGNGILDECGTCDENPDNDCTQDCNGDWGGTAVYDECGICEGTGNCDCPGFPEGTFPDCSGQCGGSLTIDECNICGGSGILEGECDCSGNIEDCSGVCSGTDTLDCAGVCAGTSEVDKCGECDGIITEENFPDIDVCLKLEETTNAEAFNLIYYSPNEPIGGFQFDHNGCIENAFGGEAEGAGFSTATSSTSVLGFSFAGTSIPAGDNLILTILEGNITGNSITDFVISSVVADELETYYLSDNVSGADCSSCESGIFDCLGVCDGDAVEDCDDECGGSAVEDECGICNGNGSTCGEDLATDGCELPGNTFYLTNENKVLYNIPDLITTPIRLFKFDLNEGEDEIYATAYSDSEGDIQNESFTFVNNGEETDPQNFNILLNNSFFDRDVFIFLSPNNGVTSNDGCGTLIVLTEFNEDSEPTELKNIEIIDINDNSISIDYYNP